MGCCLSTRVPSKHSGQQPASDINAPPLTPVHDQETAPPLTPVHDQETVKEVLSETQTPVSQTPVLDQKVVNNRLTNVLQSPAAYTGPLSTQRVVKKIEPNARIKETMEEETNIVSEVSGTSEMYSFSGSFSNATAVNDTEESGEVNQTVSSREINAARYRGVKSPAPSLVNYQVRSGLGQGRPGTLQHCNVGPIRSVLPERRGDHGRRKVGNRTPVWNVTGHSGGGSPARKAKGSGKTERGNDAVSMESLENPRVSMECFIFL